MWLTRGGALRAAEGEVIMYVSRLNFATLPGHTHQVEDKLRRLRDLVISSGGTHDEQA